jgi:hypothetical protein
MNAAEATGLTSIGMRRDDLARELPMSGAEATGFRQSGYSIAMSGAEATGFRQSGYSVAGQQSVSFR